MDLEELKAVVEMVNGLGAEAKSAFVWWLVAYVGSQAVVAMSWLFGAWLVTRVIRFLVNHICGSGRLRAAAGYYDEGCWSYKELNRVCDVLRQSRTVTPD